MQDRFQLGDILKVDRGFYYHYGVYIGDRKVIHFTGNDSGEINANSAEICQTSLSTFEKNDKIVVDNTIIHTDDLKNSIVERAKSMLGKKFGGYNLVANNCEHFARWCEVENATSKQVDKVADFIASVGVAAVSNLLNSLNDN